MHLCVHACGKHGSMSGVFYYSLPFKMASLAEPGAYQFIWAWNNTLQGSLQAHSPCTQLLHGSWDLDSVLMLA